MFGEKIFNMVKDIDNKFGKKKSKKRKHDGCGGGDGDGDGDGDENITRKLYKKISIIFNLEYSNNLLVRTR